MLSIAVAILAVIGCANPFTGENVETNGDGDVGGASISVSVGGSPGGAFSTSSISDDPEVDWVQIIVYDQDDAYVTDETLYFDGESWSGTITGLPTGLLTFVAHGVSEIQVGEYDWWEEVLYFGEADRNIDPGQNGTLTIAAGSVADLVANVTVTDIPTDMGVFGAFIGLVGTDFDLQTDIIDPYVASGYDEEALDNAASQVFVAGSEVPVSGSSVTVNLFDFSGTWPWKEIGEYNVVVMLEMENGSFLPGNIAEGEFVPYLGTVTMTDPGYTGSVSLSGATTYKDFFEVLAAGSSITVDVSNIDTGSFVRNTGYEGSSLFLGAAIFDASTVLIDQLTGEVDQSIEPVAMGFTTISVEDTAASFVIWDGTIDGGDGEDDGPPMPWLGTPGDYVVYLIIGAPESGLMYLGSQYDESFEMDVPYDFPVTLVEIPDTWEIDATGVDFNYSLTSVDFDVTDSALTGDAYGYMEFEFYSGNSEYGYNTDVTLYPSAETYIPEAYFWFNDNSDTIALDAGTYTLNELGGPMTLEEVEFGIDDYTWIGSWSGEIVSGNVTVTETDGTYTFTWTFTTSGDETISGSYTGNVDAEYVESAQS